MIPWCTYPWRYLLTAHRVESSMIWCFPSTWDRWFHAYWYWRQHSYLDIHEWTMGRDW